MSGIGRNVWRPAGPAAILTAPPIPAVTTLFLACTLLGGGILALQLVLGLLGLDHGADHELHDGAHASAGLDLLSVRSVAAGVAFFGLAGLAGLRLGLGAVGGVVAGVAAGVAAMVGTAAVLRSFRGMERDATLVLDRAIGQTGTVYLSIPGRREGTGKVHVTVQDRLVECAAVTPDVALPTGAPVLVVDVERSDVLVVVRNPQLLEESHVAP